MSRPNTTTRTVTLDTPVAQTIGWFAHREGRTNSAWTNDALAEVIERRLLDEIAGLRLGMVNGMATTKVTITLDTEQLEHIRRLVADGKVASVSGFVQHAVDASLNDVAGWASLLADALAQTGGALTGDERAWADSVLGTSAPRRRRRTA